jgi:ABC-type glycerol-3-phosphate transport system substrate-binding protein
MDGRDVEPTASGRMTRRQVLFATCAAGALAACAGPGTPPASGPGRKDLSGQKVTFLHWWTDSLGPGNNDFMAWAASTFKERTGATVELVDGPTGGGLNSKLITMITGGLPPDASFCSIVFGRDNYDAGMIRNLTPFVAKAPDIGDKEFFESSKKFRSKGNDTFGVPVMGPESLTFTINQGSFSAAGFDPKGGDLKSWDDLVRVAQRLTKANGDEFQQIGLLVPNLGLPWLATWLYSNGASPTTPDDTKYLLDVPATREAVQFSVDLIHKHRLGPRMDAPNRPSNARQAFTAGQIAIIYDSSSIRLLNAPPDFRFWIMPVPKGPRGSGVASATWTNFVAVPTESKNPDAAVEWTRFFTGLEVQVEKLKRLNSQSPRVKLYDTPEWKQAVEKEPNLARIPEVARLPGAYPYLRYNRIAAEIEPLFREMLLGKLAVNQGLADAQKKADQIMSEPVRVQ